MHTKNLHEFIAENRHDRHDINNVVRAKIIEKLKRKHETLVGSSSSSSSAGQQAVRAHEEQPPKKKKKHE
jgi:hypothetical protein